MTKLLASLLLFAGLAAAQTHSVTLTWAPNSTGDPVATYNILRGTTSGGESSTPIGSIMASACTATTCAYIDGAVIGGTTYYYQITAMNSGGTSAPSPETSFSVPYFAPSTPAKPTATGH
jgi:hypothetical protein